MNNPDLPPDSITTLLHRARELQSPVPDKARLGDLLSRGELSPNDVRWVYLAAQFVEQVIAELEPGVLRSLDDLPDEPPLFTTRRLFKALESRVERLEKGAAPLFATPAGPVTVRYWPAAPTPEQAEVAKRAVLELVDEQQPPPGRVPTVTEGGEYSREHRYSPEHRYVLRAYRQAHGQPTVGAGMPTAVEVNGAVTWWNQRQAPTVEVTTSEPDAALYFVCQNRHPLAARTTTILENGERRALHHEIVCPACEADGITEVRLPDLDDEADDD